MVRQPVVAGAFYPADARSLRHVVAHFMQAADAPPGTRPPKALIVPHAGYVYSGAVAGLAYARLAPHADAIRRVVLLGPVHRVALRGLALPEADRFATPLGELRVDHDAAARLIAMPQVTVSARAHAQEHSLEVQLPFLQSVLGEFTLLPLAVGDATAEDVAGVLEALWEGAETLIVVSSDLSHYLPYAAAVQADGETIAGILRGLPLDSFAQACGALPINGLLLVAGRHALKPRLLGRCNSGDTGGDRQRVVGYAAIEFVEDGEPQHD